VRFMTSEVSGGDPANLEPAPLRHSKHPGPPQR
jgi:hypothetical protein